MTTLARGIHSLLMADMISHIDFFYFLPSCKFGTFVFNFTLVFYQGYALNSKV